MNKKEIEEKVFLYLEMITGEKSDKFRNELEAYGDVEVDSLHFLMMTGFLSAELGINITPLEIDKFVKRSFKQFCELVLKSSS